MFQDIPYQSVLLGQVGDTEAGINIAEGANLAKKCLPES